MSTNDQGRAIPLVLNGRATEIVADGDRTLLDVLRTDCGITSPKYGCGLAQCGACTVLVDDAPARACVLRLAQAAGRRITTLEGLADAASGDLHPVQEGFRQCEGAQCGYCLSGMVMTTVALLRHSPNPTEAEVRNALRHNLCRCGTHREIVASVLRAADLMDPAHDG